MTQRRSFLLSGAALSALGGTVSGRPADGQNDAKTIRVGVMGLSRGASLAEDFASIPNVQVDYLCDVDERRAANVAKQFKSKTGFEVKTVDDFRRILDNPEIDVLVCAAPNHWHAPATIMACKAGKHVYVEKPCSHNPAEGEWMIAAANRFNRCVQMGTQRRSAAGTKDAMRRLQAGEIGDVHVARCYYNNLRGAIGTGQEVEPPAGLNYELWEGPAPHQPYRSNVVHYNWHWFWHWGGGELANNGVHGLDLCRWGLGVDFPVRTVSAGGRYWFEDDQETPDTQTASFEFEAGKLISWEALSCNKHGIAFRVVFYGNQGALELDSDGQFRQYDRNDKLVYTGEESSVGQKEHIQNFLQAVRSNDPAELNQPITEGHKSTLLCHLGNIAYRTGRTVVTSSRDGRILNDAEQRAFWEREYHPEWEKDVRVD